MGKEHDLDVRGLTKGELRVSPVDDITDGPGLQVTIGDGTCQIFPATRVARAELDGDRARIADLTRVSAHEGLLEVHGETDIYASTLRLDSESLSLMKVRRTPAHLSNDDAPSAGPASSSPDPETVAPPAESPSVHNNEDAERERVRVAGRIGYTPQFRTTSRGTLVGSFSLASHPEPGETEWHKIVTFGSRAQKLQGSGLGKGDEVEVVGYPHKRERRNPKTGQATTIVEIYAAVVKKAGAKEETSPKDNASGEV